MAGNQVVADVRAAWARLSGPVLKTWYPATLSSGAKVLIRCETIPRCGTHPVIHVQSFQRRKMYASDPCESVVVICAKVTKAGDLVETDYRRASKEEIAHFLNIVKADKELNDGQ